MTTLALPAPRMIGADLLKLRRRRGLSIVVGLLTVGAVLIAYSIIEILHLANSAKHGPAGGVTNLGHGLWLISMLGGVAAVLVGSSAGSGDLDAGVYRDLVVTGRSRLSLFLSRIPGGLAYLLPFVAVAYTLAAVATTALAGSLAAPGLRQMVLGGLWGMLEVTFYFLLAVALSTLIGSRSYTIGILLAFRLALTPLFASIHALGIVREVIPGVAMERLIPLGFGDTLRQGPVVRMSVGATAIVLVAWTVIALALGSRRDVARDA